MLFFFFIYIIYKKQKIKMGCIKVKSEQYPFIIKSKQNPSKNNYDKENNIIDSIFPDNQASQNDEIMTLNINNYNQIEIENNNKEYLNIEKKSINKQNKLSNTSENITLISINNSFFSNELNKNSIN